MGKLRAICSDLQILSPGLCRGTLLSLLCHPSQQAWPFHTLQMSRLHVQCFAHQLLDFILLAIPALVKHQAEQIPKSTSAQLSIPDHQFAVRNVPTAVSMTQENSTFQSLFWG